VFILLCDKFIQDTIQQIFYQIQPGFTEDNGDTFWLAFVGAQ